MTDSHGEPKGQNLQEGQKNVNNNPPKSFSNIATRTMATQPPFERLIRFETDEGVETYGNLSLDIESDTIVGSTVDTLQGDFRSGFTPSGAQATVSKASSKISTTSPFQSDLVKG